MTRTQLINCICSSYLYTGTNRPLNTTLPDALKDAAAKAHVDIWFQKYMTENPQ